MTVLMTVLFACIFITSSAHYKGVHDFILSDGGQIQYSMNWGGGGQKE